MALRDDIQKRIEKKRAEIAALEEQIGNATVYIQALEDTLKLLPREINDEHFAPSSTSIIRRGSKMDKAREAIRNAGRPLHITDLVAAIGRPNNTANRAALAGSLGAYSRRGEIFTRTAPNTFGILEFPKPKQNGVQTGPPPNFGLDQKVPNTEIPLAEVEGLPLET
jgi:hypothetical protein